ncbi:MAG: signal peptidase II [Clostridiales bacterium]|nr:signal peptidase II [Clostridiales bacterium]
MGHNHDVEGSSPPQTTIRTGTSADRKCRFILQIGSYMKRNIYLLIGALVIAVDQITKYLVRANMQPGDSIPVIGNWMRVYYVQNTGTAFSMFAGNRFVTIFVTSVLIIMCIVFIIKESADGVRLIPVLFTFVAAGGISNMIDRLTLGYVTDMISCGRFAVFNVADIGVTCGCILTMIALVVLYKDEDEKAAKDE